MHTHANILVVIQILTRCLCEWINPRLYWNEVIYGKGNCDSDLTQAPSLFSGPDSRCQCCFQETKDSSDKVNAEILFTNCPNTTFEGIAGIFFKISTFISIFSAWILPWSMKIMADWWRERFINVLLMLSVSFLRRYATWSWCCPITPWRLIGLFMVWGDWVKEDYVGPVGSAVSPASACRHWAYSAAAY